MLDLVTVDPAVCHGKPCIRGTRVLVSVVLSCLAAGMTDGEVISEYPTLTVDGIRAAAAYGAWLADGEVQSLIPAQR